MNTLSSATCTAAQLRREVNARAEAYARAEGLLYDVSPGASPAVVFGRDERGRHGSFHPAADHAIRASPEWARRLAKPHTASRRSLARKDWPWMELDAAVSSDALLMSIFCHPGVYDGRTLDAAVAALLGVDRASRPCFGVLPGVPLKTARKRRVRKGDVPAEMSDRTEVDLELGQPALSTLAPGSQLFLEAKLTESDFQTAAPALLERYRDLETVFDRALLPRKTIAPPPLPPNLDPDDPTVNLPVRKAKERMASYQLIRNVLAAYAAGASFCLLLDSRRRDLIEQWYAVLSAVHAPDFRWRLKLLTWQELAAVLPRDLRIFLDARYGIRS